MHYILVTGGAGYIGSHTCKVLKQEGFTPVVLDNLSTGHGWAVKWGPIYKGSIGNSTLVRSLLNEYNIEAVIHLAGNAYVGESIQNPRKYFKNNVVNSLKFLDILMDVGVNNVIFSSSCTTYGLPTKLPIREDHAQAPVNPYGDSKLFIEKVLKWYGSAYGLRWTILRYFNAAGSDPEGEIGEVHIPETHLFPLAIQTASGQQPCLNVYGTDYPTPDGTAIRDYIHVMDLAKAHVLSLKRLLDLGNSQEMNLGTGNGYSVFDVIREVEAVSGKKIPIKNGPRRPGDPPVLVADTKKSMDILGWKPEMSSLNFIAKTAWNWHCLRHYPVL